MGKKEYWISAHRKVNDVVKVAAYAALAKSALTSHGGRYLALDMPAHVYEAGIKARIVIIEFDNVAAAVAAHQSSEYQKALEVLGDGAERDLRIIEGLD
ncbi:MAG TPA: DUF1330 domain-containing protein [Xanthobacteraceae bacterium]|jgi:uncharacterized protein (DUF1330 family)|nr:DUF1330 domain-containing protein [Xanthobacteraceae bacterium]